MEAQAVVREGAVVIQADVTVLVALAALRWILAVWAAGVARGVVPRGDVAVAIKAAAG